MIAYHDAVRSTTSIKNEVKARFRQNGYQVIVMPMLTSEANEQAKAERETKAQSEQPAEVADDTTDQVEVEKPERSRKRDKVAVA